MRGAPKNPISVLRGGKCNRLVKTDDKGLLAESEVNIDDILSHLVSLHLIDLYVPAYGALLISD